jgi:hypothetical protein
MDPAVPDGWAVTDTTAADGWSYFGGQNTFLGGLALSDSDGVSGEYTHTYTVQVPEDATAGDYTVSSEGSVIEPASGDRIADTASTTVTVEVPTQNTPPTADAGADQTVDEGTTVTLDASGSNDPDASDVLTYTWTQTEGQSVSISDAMAEQATFTAPDVDSETTLTFQVEATDGDTVDTDTVDVTVQPTNDQPVADAGPDQTVIAGETVQFDGTGSSDPEGETLSYSWTLTGGPSVGSLADTNVAQPTFTASDTTTGTAVYELEVTDTQGATATDTVEVTVEPAPEASVAVAHSTDSTTVAPGETVTITATFTQMDANSPAMVPTVPDGWAITDTTAAGDWSYVAAQQTFLGSLSLSDSDGVSGEYTHTYTVKVPADAEPGDYTVSSEGSAIEPVSGDNVTDTASTTITIEEPGLDPVVGENPPMDHDGDGKYEDVNGDGKVDVGDAQAIFANDQSPVVQNNVDAFDFNGDGSVNVGDAQALFVNGLGV